MFTGIVEQTGVVWQINRQGQTLILTIQAHEPLTEVKLGSSLAVNGVCLTITALHHETVTADVMPATFKATTLAKLRPGQSVNLERAMPAAGRFDGHLVLGHVDGIGQIKRRLVTENAVKLQITLPAELHNQVVTKGSIAVDGTSLTVGQVHVSNFEIDLIPTTQRRTCLGNAQVGQWVNLEIDVVYRYLQAINGGSKHAS